MDFDEETRFF